MPAATFTDLAGRTWRLDLNYGLALEIEAALGVDLANAHNGQALQQLATDAKLFFQTLTLLCQDQLAERSLSEKQFLSGFNDETVERATQAVEQMLVLFTRPALRPVIAGLLHKRNQTQHAAITVALDKIESPAAQALIDRQIEQLGQQIDAALQLPGPATATNSPGSGPASPASIPAATASGSSTGSPAAATNNSGTTPAP